MREQACGLGTLIGDECLVRDFVHPPRQRGPPMRDEPVELHEVPADVAQVARVVVVRKSGGEQLAEIAEPGIEWMTAQNDDARGR